MNGRADTLVAVAALAECTTVLPRGFPGLRRALLLRTVNRPADPALGRPDAFDAISTAESQIRVGGLTTLYPT